MLVKLAYAMQRLKKYQKNFVMINNLLGGAIFRFCGGTYSSLGSPPLGKTLFILFLQKYFTSKSGSLYSSICAFFIVLLFTIYEMFCSCFLVSFLKFRILLYYYEPDKVVRKDRLRICLHWALFH